MKNLKEIPAISPFHLEISNRAIAEAADYDLLADDDKIYYELELQFRMKLFELLHLINLN